MTQNSSEEREALRWLAERMRWEQFLADLHAGRIPTPAAADSEEPLAA